MPRTQIGGTNASHSPVSWNANDRVYSPGGDGPVVVDEAGRPTGGTGGNTGVLDAAGTGGGGSGGGGGGGSSLTAYASAGVSLGAGATGFGGLAP